MKKAYQILVLLCLLFSGMTSMMAQETWRYNVATSAETIFNSITAVESGNFIAVGTTRLTTDGNRRPVVVKLNSSYEVIWARIVNTALDCEVYDVIYDAETRFNSNYLLVGTAVNTSSDSDVLLMRFTSTGTCDLNKVYSSIDEEGITLAAARAITPITNSSGVRNYVITGFTNRNPLSNGDGFAICVSTSGAVVWKKSYDMHTSSDNYVDWAAGALFTTDNKLYITTSGASKEGSPNYYDQGLMRINPNSGEIISKCQYRTTASETIYDVVALSNGNLVMLSSVLPSFSSTGQRDIVITCVDSATYSVIWSNKYTSRHANAAFNIKVDANDVIYVNGFSSGTSNSNQNLTILAVNGSNGAINTSRTRTYGKSTRNEKSGMNSGILVGANKFVAVGSTNLTTNGTVLEAYLTSGDLNVATRTDCDTATMTYTSSNYPFTTLKSIYRAKELTITNGTGTAPTAVDVVRISNCCTAFTTTITGNTTICPDDVSTLTASAASSTYVWSTGETTASIDVSPALTSTYTVTSTNTSGCTSTATVTVFVKNAFPASISGPSIVCLGSNATLIATGGVSCSWFNGVIASSIVVTPNAPTTYAAIITGSNGCQEKRSININVSSVTASIAGASAVCLGSSTTLTASGGGTYNWSTGATTAAISVTPTTNTIYSVTVTNTNGCTAVASLNVTVNPVPAGNITATANTICAGAQVGLTASGGSSYLWSTGATTPSITGLQPNVNTTYTVVVSNGTCKVTLARTIIVTQTPITITTTCYSGSPIVLSASFSGTNPTYLWGPNVANTSSITVNSAGNYSVSASNAASCTASISFMVSSCPTDGLGTSDEGTLTNPASFDGNSSNLAFTSSNQVLLSKGVSLELAPNPTPNEINLNLTLPNLQDVSVSILDLTGRVLQQHQLGQVQSIKQTFSLSDLPSGMYLLIVKGDNGQLALAKIIKE